MKPGFFLFFDSNFSNIVAIAVGFENMVSRPGAVSTILNDIARRHG